MLARVTHLRGQPITVSRRELLHLPVTTIQIQFVLLEKVQ